MGRGEQLQISGLDLVHSRALIDVSPQLSLFFIPVTFIHPLAICIRSGLRLPDPRLLAEVFDELHGCERVGGIGECPGDDLVGFVWYSPLLFARRWTILMGYDSDDKAKLAEMQKSAGPSYMLSLIASVLSAAVLGKIIAIATIHTPLYGIKIGLAVWLGFVTTVQLTSALFMPQPASCWPSTPAIN